MSQRHRGTSYSWSGWEGRDYKDGLILLAPLLFIVCLLCAVCIIWFICKCYKECAINSVAVPTDIAYLRDRRSAMPGVASRSSFQSQNRPMPPPPVARPSAPPLNEVLVQEAILNNIGDQTVQSESRQDSPPPSYSECVNIDLQNL
ncbi:uncharacterized protein LOC118438269 [Folsomia candida]|uniref:uncharacterized protein LOC118438269 n=1 Tax=Folsomia candida TaxID=158441 RepID=UPI001604ED0A|nr:uncharacterized protein LOC118438269 [Folsomia candida]